MKCRLLIINSLFLLENNEQQMMQLSLLLNGENKAICRKKNAF